MPSLRANMRHFTKKTSQWQFLKDALMSRCLTWKFRFETPLTLNGCLATNSGKYAFCYLGSYARTSISLLQPRTDVDIRFFHYDKSIVLTLSLSLPSLTLNQNRKRALSSPHLITGQPISFVQSNFTRREVTACDKEIYCLTPKLSISVALPCPIKSL